MGGGRKPVKASGLVILQHVPGLTAKLLAMNGDMGAQTRPQLGDAIP